MAYNGPAFRESVTYVKSEISMHYMPYVKRTAPHRSSLWLIWVKRAAHLTSCLSKRNRRTVMGGRCQTFRCCGDFLQNWCHAWLFVASVSIWLGLLTSQLRHWTVHLSEMAFLKVKHPNSGHWAVCWVNSRDWKVEGCQRCNLSRLKTGHFPSLHHSQLTLTLTLTRLEAGETFFKSVNSTSTTSQLYHSQLDIVQCATSWKPFKDAPCQPATGQLVCCIIRVLCVHDTTLIFIYLINIWWKSTKTRIFLLQEKYRILQEEKVCCCCILSGPLPSPDTRHNCFKFEAFDDTSRKKKEWQVVCFEGEQTGKTKITRLMTVFKDE